MIRGVVDDLDGPQGGLGYNARIEGRQVAGKTGTTNDIKDLWFVGTTPGLTGAVWVGKQAGGSLPAWAYSGTIPAPIWQRAVAGSLEGTPVTTFKEPPGIEYAVVRRVNMAFRTQPVEPPAAQQPQSAAPEQPAPQPVDPPQPEAQSPSVFIDPQTQQAYPQPEDLMPEDSVPEDLLPAAPESSAADPNASSGFDPGFDNGAADPSVDFQGNQGEVQIIPQTDSAASGGSADFSQSIPDPVAPPEAPPGN